MSDAFLEEYRHLRELIEEREKYICQYFLFAISANGFVLAALGGWIFGNGGLTSALNLHWMISVFFLSPLLVTVPIGFLLVAIRRELHLIAKYVQVFYDEAGLGPRWETHVEQFRHRYKRQYTLEVIPSTFWLFHLCCTICFVVGMYELHGPHWVAPLVALAIFIITLWFNLSFSRVTTVERPDYIRIWRSIYEEEASRKRKY